MVVHLTEAERLYMRKAAQQDGQHELIKKLDADQSLLDVQFIKVARELHACEGVLQFPDGAPVNVAGERGGWVMGWQWVDADADFVLGGLWLAELAKARGLGPGVLTPEEVQKYLRVDLGQVPGFNEATTISLRFALLLGAGASLETIEAWIKLHPPLTRAQPA